MSADGGTSEENGFLISTNESGTVLAFSLIGSSIPPGENILTNLSYSMNEMNETEICIGNGILNVENYDQAISRADPNLKNFGGNAAIAALTLVEIKQNRMAK